MAQDFKQIYALKYTEPGDVMPLFLPLLMLMPMLMLMLTLMPMLILMLVPLLMPLRKSAVITNTDRGRPRMMHNKKRFRAYCSEPRIDHECRTTDCDIRERKAFVSEMPYKWYMANKWYMSVESRCK